MQVNGLCSPSFCLFLGVIGLPESYFPASGAGAVRPLVESSGCGVPASVPVLSGLCNCHLTSGKLRRMILGSRKA